MSIRLEQLFIPGDNGDNGVIAVGFLRWCGDPVLISGRGPAYCTSLPYLKLPVKVAAPLCTAPTRKYPENAL